MPVGAFLGLKLDTGDDEDGMVAVGDLGIALTSLSDLHADFTKKMGATGSETNFQIRDLRKGSTILEFVGMGIGLIDQGLIMHQFHGHVAKQFAGWTTKKFLKDKKPVDAQARKIEAMAQAVANSEDGNLALAYQRETSDERETLMMTKQDAQKMLENFSSARQNFKEDVPLINYDTPQRLLMRLYQHNQDPNPSEKKRTAHKAIIRDIDLKARPLSYGGQTVSDELNEIVSEQPYGSIIFDVDVSLVREDGTLKTYRLEQIHGFFEDWPTNGMVRS